MQFYNDLSKDDDLFMASGDYQFDIYRLMKEKLGWVVFIYFRQNNVKNHFYFSNNWNKFEPYTNILWLHYLVDKMMHGVQYKQKNNKKHLTNIDNTFKNYQENILKFKSSEDFAKNFLQAMI